MRNSKYNVMNRKLGMLNHEPIQGKLSQEEVLKRGTFKIIRRKDRTDDSK